MEFLFAIVLAHPFKLQAVVHALYGYVKCILLSLVVVRVVHVMEQLGEPRIDSYRIIGWHYFQPHSIEQTAEDCRLKLVVPQEVPFLPTPKKILCHAGLVEFTNFFVQKAYVLLDICQQLKNSRPPSNINGWWLLHFLLQIFEQLNPI